MNANAPSDAIPLAENARLLPGYFDALECELAGGKPMTFIHSTDCRAKDVTRGTRGPSGEVVPARDYQLTNHQLCRTLVRARRRLAYRIVLQNDFRATLNGENVLLSCRLRIQTRSDSIGGRMDRELRVSAPPLEMCR